MFAIVVDILCCCTHCHHELSAHCLLQLREVKPKLEKKKKIISIHFVVALSILGGVSVGKVNLRLFCFQKGSKNKKGSHRVNC